MSDFDIRSAFRERLLTLTGLPAQQWENKAYEPVLGTPYLKEKLMPAASRIASWGDASGTDGFVRDDGVYQLSLFYPAGDDTKAAEEMAMAIRSLFKPGTVLLYGSLKIECRRSVKATAVEEPGWYQVPVSVTYFVYRLNT